MEAALNEQNREAIRLPIARPSIPVNTTLGYDNIKAVKSLENAAGAVAAVAPVPTGANYDFSAAAGRQKIAESLTANPVQSPKTMNAPATSGKYFIQLATAESMKEAGKIVEKAKAQGVQTKVQEAVIGEKSYFRVLRGPFESRPIAEAEIGKLESLGVASGQPFVRTID